MSTLLGIYGASGFGREVMPLLAAMTPTDATLVFIDDGSSGAMNGRPICSFEDFCAVEGEKKVCIAIADSNVRQKLAERCENAQLGVLDVHSANISIGDEVSIGSGSIICGFSTLTSNIKVGRYFHSNIYSYVAHDCVIGDFVTFAPSVKCNGNVHIDDYAYIGTGAILKQGTAEKPLKIGRGAIVGMGAVVTKNVAPGAIVVGNPATVMQPRQDLISA